MSDPTIQLLLGRCEDRLAEIPTASIHAMICDPPAGIEFMGKDWDSDRGGRDQWIAWLRSVMEQCLWAARPGAHGLVWALPRTSHWTAMALEDAGWEVRDVIMHVFGQGFAKSVDVGRQIDMHRCTLPGRHYDKTLPKPKKRLKGDHLCPPHPDGDPWRGSGSGLKPAAEHWILVRKPLDGTIAESVLEHGTGGIDVDGCRIESGGTHGSASSAGQGKGYSDTTGHGIYGAGKGGVVSDPHPSGRWPPHLLLSHSRDCELIGERRVKTGKAVKHRSGGKNFGGGKKPVAPDQTFADEDGTESMSLYRCVPGCPVREMDRQSGELVGSHGRGNGDYESSGVAYNDPVPGSGPVPRSYGGASRFFPCFRYQAKPSRSEREAGCEHLPTKSGAETVDREEGSAGMENPRAGAGRTADEVHNPHPTVKSLGLMRWLCRLVTPPGGTILDPFMGSGTTGMAAFAEGFSFVGIEQDPSYMALAQARIEWIASTPVEVEGDYERPDPQPGQVGLFT